MNARTTEHEKSARGEAAATVALGRLSRYAFLAALAALIALLLMAFGPDAALAQQDGGDAIKSTLANVRDYIGGLMILLGGIGFAVSLGLKAASPVNENAQYLAHMGMKSSAIAVIGGAILGPIMSIIQGLAGG